MLAYLKSSYVLPGFTLPQAEHVPLAGSYENHSRFTSRPETHSRSGEPDLQVYAEVDHHLASNRLRNGYLIPKHSNYWILPYVISGQPKQPLTVSKEFNNRKRI